MSHSVQGTYLPVRHTDRTTAQQAAVSPHAVYHVQQSAFSDPGYRI